MPPDVSTSPAPDPRHQLQERGDFPFYLHWRKDTEWVVFLNRDNCIIRNEELAAHWPPADVLGYSTMSGQYRSPRPPYSVEDLLRLAYRRCLNRAGAAQPQGFTSFEAPRLYRMVMHEWYSEVPAILALTREELDAEAALYLLETENDR